MRPVTNCASPDDAVGPDDVAHEVSDVPRKAAVTIEPDSVVISVDALFARPSSTQHQPVE